MNPAYLGFGEVRHHRLRPVDNAFTYPTFFLLLAMRSMHASGSPALAHNRAGAISFHDKDHGDGRANALQWLDELLRREGITDATGEAWLLCYPRVLGLRFKPVSFWFCERADGSLSTVVAEVNNTFGERHCYLLDAPAWGREAVAAKAFHVSPFCDVAGTYRFRFMLARGKTRALVRVDHDDAQGPLLRTSISGQLQQATRLRLWGALCRYPLLAAGIVARIHWQALRLWLLGVGFRAKPAAPDLFLTR